MKFRIIYTIFTALLVGALFLGSSNGPINGGVGVRTGAPGEGLCTNCHGGGSFSPTISIQMLDGSTPITTYTPGQSYTLRVAVGGGGGCYGAQATVLTNSGNTTAGVLSAPNIGTSIRASGGRTYIEHNTRSTTGIFTANWVAPATGTGSVTVYAAGIACNGTGNTSGDNGTNGSLTLSEAIPTTINYPNATYCLDGSNPSPTIGGNTGGSFSSNPALNINSSTGAINLAASSAGSYTVSYTHASGTATTTVALLSPEAATISYPSATICRSSGIVSPTVVGTTGGVFSSTPGLSINSSTGAINTANSTANTYFVTYRTLGTCPDTTTFTLTIQNETDAAFIYSGSSFCQSVGNINSSSMNSGGTYSASPAGLSLNSSTGAINISASNVGNYQVFYTTAGLCPDTDTVALTVTAAGNADFAYPVATLCRDAAALSPNISGNSGGTFSSTAGLSINSSTGAINPATSTAGNYQIIYSVSGVCPAADTQSLNITNVDIANFFYSASVYCIEDTSLRPTPTLNSNTNGNFSVSPSGLVFANSSTGEIDLSASNVGQYLISYITAGTCPDTLSQNITLGGLCSNIRRQSQTEFSISPNPSSGRIRINIQSISSSQILQIVLIDATGRVVLRDEQLPSGAEFSHDLNLEYLPKGVYWLRIQQGDQFSIKPIHLQ
jgi:hypothetical protein